MELSIIGNKKMFTMVYKLMHGTAEAENIIYYSPYDNIYELKSINEAQNLKTEVIYTKNNSIEELLEQKKINRGKIALLNFADGRIVGGLVKQGEETQEEQLCRRSNLYDYLENCPDYYEFNRRCENQLACTDGIIYSKDVWFVLDNKYELLLDNIHCDVITCPAPYNGSLSENLIKERMRKIIYAAYINNVDTLILGTWGCGAYHNNWAVFGSYWQEVISENNLIRKIIFPLS